MGKITKWGAKVISPIQSNFNYKYIIIICLKKLNLIDSNVIICVILTPFHNPISQSLLPSPLKLQYNPKQITYECVLCVWRFYISFMYVLQTVESKLPYLCLITDHSQITQLHFFVYERTEFSSISLECTNVKLSILDNFGPIL